MSDGDIEVGTKRSSEDYDEYGEIASYKKQRTENLSLRFLQLGRLCGGIIGKAGANIKRLRTEYSVQINVPDTRSKDRVLTIAGDRGNCIGALRDILPSCTEAPYSVGAKDRGNMKYEINFLVQSDQVGSLIGKAGAKVKEIRDESNGKIKIYQDCLPNSNERVVAIGGDESEILAALDIVLDALREKPKKDISRYYDPKNAGDSMGMRGGGGGGNQMGLGGGLGGAMGGLGGMGLGGGLLGQLGGAGGILGAGIANLWGQGGRGAADQMNGILGSGGADRRGGQSGGYSTQGGMNGGSNVAGILGQMNNSNSNRGNRDRNDRDRGDDERTDFGQMQTVTKITVTNDMCGAIIGKGGTRIRDIRQTSGARIDFSESERGSKEDREITLTGTQSQVQICEQLMTQYVRNRNN